MLYQLSYVSGTPENKQNLQMERVMGIEPTPSAWKAEVLPLNYTRSASRPVPVEAYASHSPDMVEGVGFEPTKA